MLGAAELGGDGRRGRVGTVGIEEELLLLMTIGGEVDDDGAGVADDDGNEFED